ncbi:glycoside hydrolase family 16 protein [Daejeonella lutea]|uniref:Beta-glucanase, GH16 family n=1 Tax=Daejeonella lutea TaxID=572036 RepID=A0A1T5AD04_9SPHI|nr:glycoside hydrolase family 16 protein [Daejeonella lutea]SKB32810.1 Beta-glucanase, GH16 family [Daejeonella lutea]
MFAFTSLTILCLACTKDGSTQISRPVAFVPPIDKGWSFETSVSWSDEFEYTGLPSPAKWGYDIGGSGWGNNELQYYTDNINNVSVGNGKLTIALRKEYFNGKDYTSARLVSKGKGDFLYGRIEVKAKLPEGKGTWPAIWMLPTDWEYGGWPKSGEIDIMEHVGYDQHRVHVTVHTEAYNHGIKTQRGTNRIVPATNTEFHLYRVDWTPYAIRGFIDNEQMFEFVNEGKGSPVWPFDKRFHLLLNIAFGGNWGGSQGIDHGNLPQTMEVDYVRVYKMIDKN